MVDPWNDDTAPQRAVELPQSPVPAGRAAEGVASVLVVRAVIAAAAAVALTAAAVLLFRHAMRHNAFPLYTEGSGSAAVTRYSGPWIAGSGALALLAGLAFASFGVDVFRRVRLQRVHRRP